MNAVKERRFDATTAELKSQSHEGRASTERTYEIPTSVQRAMGYSAQIGRAAAKKALKKK